MAEVHVLTPPGPGGVAVLSVRGSDARARVAALVVGELPAPGGLRVVRLARGDEDLDEAIVCVRSEVEIELHLHGSPPLVEELAGILAGDAPAPRRPRSLEDRALERTPRAPSEEGARVLLDQSGGALRRSLRALTELTGEARIRALEQLVARGRSARFLLERPLVVLAGAVNAGKSTLFNALVGERRVVVSAEAGTTRDVIRAPAALGAWPIELVDTAGERAPDDVHRTGCQRKDVGPSADRTVDAVERAGQALAREVRAAADLVLWLVPVGADAWAPQDAALLRTFADRLTGTSADRPRDALSALSDPAGARAVVERAFRARFGLPEHGHEPGAGVPFEAAQRVVLAELLARAVTDRRPDDGAFERALAGLLDPADVREADPGGLDAR